MMFWPLFFLCALLVLAAVRANLRTASLVLGASILFYGAFGNSWILFVILALAAVIVLLPLNLLPLRQEWLSRPLFFGFKRLHKALAPDTLIALDAASPGWDASLLGGEFDWTRLSSLPLGRPSPQEQLLIERLVDEYRRLCITGSGPAARLQWLHSNGLFGAGIAREHGGLGLSIPAQSALLTTLASLDSDAANAIGEGTRRSWIELLLRHGTHAQTDRYLPGLVDGSVRIGRMREAFSGIAVATRVVINSESTVALRLRLNASALSNDECTLLCIVVDVQDPSALLDPAARSGAACLLLPRDTAGLRVGGHPDHTLLGEALVIADEVIVGGTARIGRGLVDLEAAEAIAGAIALPALHAGISITAALVAGGYARMHAPFCTAEGERAAAQEALAAIAASAYASRALAAGAAQAVSAEGDPPLSPAAFTRSFTLDQHRRIEAAAGDLGLRGTAIGSLLKFDGAYCGRGLPPRLARPVDYTLCVLSGHAGFAQALAAARNPNPAAGLELFDAALFGHLGHMLSSGTRALVLAVSGGVLSSVPLHSITGKRIAQRINRYSAALAFATDVSLSRIGADLASRRSFTARRSAHEAARLTLTTWLGDALAQLWLATCAVKYFEDSGVPATDRALVESVCGEAIRGVEEALDQVLRHLSSPTLAFFTRALIFPLGRGALAPSDDANRVLAQQLLDESYLRSALSIDDPRMATLGAALTATLDGELLAERAAAAAPPGPAFARVEAALAAGAIDPVEAQQLLDWLCAVRAVQAGPNVTAVSAADGSATGPAKRHPNA